MDGIEICSPVKFDAGGSALRTFANATCYSGAMLKTGVGGLVIDVESLTLADRLPLLFGRAGVGTAHPRVRDGRVLATGTLYLDGPGRDIAAKADRGFVWQIEMSLGRAHQAEDIAEGATIRVNGRLFAGPLTVWRQCAVRAFSVTAVSIDERSHLAFAAGWPVGGQSTRFLAHPAGDLYLPI